MHKIFSKKVVIIGMLFFHAINFAMDREISTSEIITYSPLSSPCRHNDYDNALAALSHETQLEEILKDTPHVEHCLRLAIKSNIDNPQPKLVSTLFTNPLIKKTVIKNDIDLYIAFAQSQTRKDAENHVVPILREIKIKEEITAFVAQRADTASRSGDAFNGQHVAFLLYACSCNDLETINTVLNTQLDELIKDRLSMEFCLFKAIERNIENSDPALIRMLFNNKKIREHVIKKHLDDYINFATSQTGKSLHNYALEFLKNYKNIETTLASVADYAPKNNSSHTSAAPASQGYLDYFANAIGWGK